jgi:hypothetical protein
MKNQRTFASVRKNSPIVLALRLRTLYTLIAISEPKLRGRISTMRLDLKLLLLSLLPLPDGA